MAHGIEDYQMEYGGLTFGLGTAIGLEDIAGFDDFNMTMGDTSIPRQWGDVPGLHTAQGKEVTLQITTHDPAAMAIALAAFQPSDEPMALYLRMPGVGDRFVWARVISRAMPRNPGHKFKQMMTIRFKAADPRIYASVEESDTMSIYDPSGGGTDYAKNGNVNYIGDPTAGEITAQNDGSTLTYPLIRFYGPSTGTMTGATVQNITTGAEAVFVFVTPMSIGDIFYADMRRIVTVDPGDEPYISLGVTNRYGDWQLPRTPFAIQPGPNVLRFEGTGTTTDASAVITWRDASL